MCRSLQPKSPPRIWVHLMVPVGPGGNRTACHYDGEKIKEISLQLSIFTQSVQTFAQTLAAQTTKITNIEQVIGSLLARITSVETNAASGSESPDSTRSWNVLGRSDNSTVTGSLGSSGPGSSDDNRNTTRRLDTSTSPEDEQTRSAVLLRFPCAQYLTGIMEWFNSSLENQTFQHITGQSEFTAKQVPFGQTRF